MKRFERLIDPFEPAHGPPPRTLWAFGRWAMRGTERPLILLLLVSFATGLTEAATAWLVGWVVDLVATEPTNGFLSRHWLELGLIAAFFLILRPGLMSASAAFNSRTFMPNVWTMTLNRVHRHVLGHSLKYFEDDFAGRLAQKETQSSIALADVVQESIQAIL